jgi:creatinine amidohydrolase
MPIEFTLLNSDQVRSLSRSQTVFFFSVGALEDHGPHLPIGIDLKEGLHLSKMAAQKLESEKPGWTGVILPGLPLAVQTSTSAMNITVRAHVLRDALVDTCRSLIRLGFCHFVCFSGTSTPRQLTAIEEAGKMVRGLGGWRILTRGKIGANLDFGKFSISECKGCA